MYAAPLLLSVLLSACGGGDAPTGDTQAPTVTLSATPAAAAEGGTVTLSAAASDNVGVSKVSFFDGVAPLGEDTSEPYSLSVTLAAGSSGSHSYTARAYDAAGNSTVSAAQVVTVTVSASTAGVWDSSNWDEAVFQ
ncbi:Fibronectin type III domain protein [Deinococcus marmoris]|uniref:Fibronectin type III domain protein n=2 Tax=Deinococcus marmoris TaxID=249408 RepID=A0A1U7NS64_9DEIO|nr:Fibronectin type III domain protein [Deinococcus marmoris]